MRIPCLLILSGLLPLLGCHGASVLAHPPTIVVSDGFDLSKAAITGHTGPAFPGTTQSLFAIVKASDEVDGNDARLDWSYKGGQAFETISSSRIKLPLKSTAVSSFEAKKAFPPGTYNVAFFVDGRKTAEKSFEVLPPSTPKPSVAKKTTP